MENKKMQNTECPKCKRENPCIQQFAIKRVLEKHIKNELLLELLYGDLGMKNKDCLSKEK
jgi:hypothetical protein